MYTTEFIKLTSGLEVLVDQYTGYNIDLDLLITL